MKRIILILAAVIMVLCTACSSVHTSGNGEENPQIKLQTEVISSFGISQKQNRIVAYKSENEYLEYVVAMYDGNKKTSEKTGFCAQMVVKTPKKLKTLRKKLCKR